MGFKAEYGLKNTVIFLVWVTGWVVNYIFEYGALTVKSEMEYKFKFHRYLSFSRIQHQEKERYLCVSI